MIQNGMAKSFVGKVKLNLNVDDGDDRWLIISKVSLYRYTVLVKKKRSMPAAVTILIAPPPHKLCMCLAFRLKIFTVNVSSCFAREIVKEKPLLMMKRECEIFNKSSSPLNKQNNFETLALAMASPPTKHKTCVMKM